MISCFAHCGMELEAVFTFFEMVEFGEYPNQLCFSAVIQACCSGEMGWVGLVIFGFVNKTGYFESDICVGCALIDLFAKGFGDLRSAKKVFDRMPVRNLVTWTLMITRFSQLAASRDAVGLFMEMVSEGFVPDRFTFSGVLSACAEPGLSLLGRQLHGWVIKSRLSSDVCVGCSLVDMYAKRYVQSGHYDMESIKLYSRMIDGPVKPNHFTFSSLLKACGNLSNLVIGEQICKHAVKLGLASVNCVANSLISMYAKFGRMEEARKAFELLFEKNLVSYYIIVDGYSKNLDSAEAFELFSQIDSEVGVDAFTFASLLSGAASVGAVGKGDCSIKLLGLDYSEEDGKEDAQDEEAQDDDLEDTDEENEACQNSGEDDDFDTDGSLYMGILNPSQLLKLSCSSMALKTMKVILSSSCQKGKELRNQKSRWMMIILMPRTAPQIDWRSQESIESIRIRFVSKGWSKAARGGGSRDVDGNDDVGEDDEDLFGDFEDLETGQKYESHEIGDAGTDNMIRKDDESAV
ncbi:hypothetical protein K7X08_009495 [Anisodus acutangulus]|uniref:Pentatricopeptide repeat-containing protein n=1 Tax=Anisodus acutangulus TaxID=402998 RepID=A0A9Q1MZM3_9SOLA|nr:hypothetical protein K7X08_009495 [Anisodus acutangulus]